MTVRPWRRAAVVIAASLLLGGSPSASPAHADVTYDGGTGGIAFGVAPYGGAPNVGGPTYIANNFTGNTDILTSPGRGTLGGYLTASPVVANNLASFGPGPLPMAASQVGGGNGSGAFGSGVVVNSGPVVGFLLADSGPGGGSASYEITSGIIHYTVQGAAVPAGSSFGAYLSMGGAVPLVGNADVVALRALVTDTAGVLGAGGLDLPQMVLAISRNGSGAGIGNYNIVTIGGAAGGGAALILDNGTVGAFRALAVDNLLTPGALPVGDMLTVTYTFTGFADPANFSSFDPINSTDLLSLTGPLPTLSLVGDGAVPEPSSLALCGLGLAIAGGLATRGRKSASK